MIVVEIPTGAVCGHRNYIIKHYILQNVLLQLPRKWRIGLLLGSPPTYQDLHGQI